MSRFRRIFRSVAITLVAPAAGFVLVMLLELLLKVEVSKLLSSVINLGIVSLLAFWVFPRLLGIPFGRVPVGEFLRRSGLYFPEGTWKHILLGLVLAACTLSGMLIASLLSGKYQVRPESINLAHIVFS